MTSQSKMCLGAAGGFGMALLAAPILVKWLRQKESAGGAVTKEYEFGGPPGAFATMLSLPGVIFFLYYSCSKEFVVRGFDLRSLAQMPLPDVSSLLGWRAAGLAFGWFGFQVLLERTLPTEEKLGVDLASAGGEGRLSYRMNAHKAFWVSLALAAGCGTKLAVLYDEYVALAGASILGSTALSLYLYAASFAPGALLAKGGNSGNPIYDFFIGRELNPRIGSFDLKCFCELRPGLIGWMLLNLGMAAKQHQITGSISGSMVLVNVMQGLYVWDALYHEPAILSTMDITTDGFGYMLAFGDLAWVPFTYGLQARYLVDHDPQLSPLALAVCAGLGLGGYVIFRKSNSEKDAFRRDPTDPAVQHLQVLKVTNLQTGRPSNLLVSGWWGLARKINYTGDWLMAWAWSMTTGLPVGFGASAATGSVITYFYPIYFAVLLVHRAGRDDHFCKEKYGPGWAEYKKRVPYVFFPGLI